MIAFNLSKQKKLKIGYLGDDKFSIAAYESYFGPYFENRDFKNVNELMEGINNKTIIYNRQTQKSRLINNNQSWFAL